MAYTLPRKVPRQLGMNNLFLKKMVLGHMYNNEVGLIPHTSHKN
jgi:hypothetical protein